MAFKWSYKKLNSKIKLKRKIKFRPKYLNQISKEKNYKINNLNIIFKRFKEVINKNFKRF